MTFVYLLLALIALGFLVFIHELAHYFVARAVGMKVETFSIGFGNPILKWQRRGVNWQLGWIPFGGFVKITGMEVAKKEATGDVDLYTIHGGFFSKSPLARMAVALAGPVANFIFALLAFTGLWLAGGRYKPFSEFTRIVGWIDQKSSLYEQGLRPGDVIAQYNGKPYEGAKDLLYETLFGAKQICLEGTHVDYDRGKESNFDYEIVPYAGENKNIKKTGVSGAQFLIYDHLPGGKPNPIAQNSPMINSGIEYGDRIVWADGNLIFSLDELSHILNDNRAFLTVKRGDKTLFSRQKRVLAGDLLVPTQMRHELSDWGYEAGIRKRWQQLNILPYSLTSDAIVEAPLPFMTKPVEFPPLSTELEAPLEKGDRIVAIDGVPVTTAYQLLDLLQARHIHLIVARGESALKGNTPWTVEDPEFFKSMDSEAINAVAEEIGKPEPERCCQHYALLYPVEPKRYSEFAQSSEPIEPAQNRYVLGVALQDKQVVYNPGPLVLFKKVLIETWQTLKGLLSGMSLKFISGPVGIVQVIQSSWQLGIGEALFWIGAISLNLAFLNLLPIPVLDGGYICLSLWELITRKRLKAKTLERIVIPFVVMFFALLIFLTFQDIMRFFS